MAYGKIYVTRIGDASVKNKIVGSWKNSYEIPYTKYNIKESDFRIKTATFTSPNYFDLTEGLYAILINSKYHENFAGLLLDVEYDEETGLYDYQCQDWSRRYMTKYKSMFNSVKLYNILRYLIAQGEIPLKPTKKQLKPFKPVLSGLKAKGKYDQSLYKGNRYKGNPFNQSISFVAQNISLIELIRSLVYNSLGYFDVYFNDKGVLQVKPLSKTDWESSGLILNAGEYYDRKFKFSTTNAITSVQVNGADFSFGNPIGLGDITGLKLSAFFGNVMASVDNPNNNVTSAVTTTTSNNNSNKTNNNNNTGKTSNKTNKYNNPFNNKPKRVWINSDNGSDSMKKALAKQLKKNGWTVHIGRTDSNAHYSDYWNVTKKYSVYITLYNGFCAGTIREAYSSKIQNELKRKGVQLVPIWDSAGWTNPKGMKPYRYGDFSKYSASRAWDDNFSRGNPSIKNVGDYFKKNKATYCVSPSASQIMKQFNAGGYFRYKGIKV